MTQEQKNLLLKDLCARLPYGVKVRCDFGLDGEITEISRTKNNLYYCKYLDCKEGYCYIESLKPYLFPLSSITEEQEKELSKLGVSYGEYALHDDTRGLGIMVDEAYVFFEFCYKHHIDFLGLIEIGLAIDATGKNIY